MPDDSPRGRPASLLPAAGTSVSGPTPQGPASCSARGCARPASWALRWRNPKIHATDRRKVWLACDEHRESLAEFLSARAFLRDVVPFEADQS
jgi:hypothetical protein